MGWRRDSRRRCAGLGVVSVRRRATAERRRGSAEMPGAGRQSPRPRCSTGPRGRPCAARTTRRASASPRRPARRRLAPLASGRRRTATGPLPTGPGSCSPHSPETATGARRSRPRRRPVAPRAATTPRWCRPSVPNGRRSTCRRDRRSTAARRIRSSSLPLLPPTVGAEQLLDQRAIVHRRLPQLIGRGLAVTVQRADLVRLAVAIEHRRVLHRQRRLLHPSVLGGVAALGEQSADQAVRPVQRVLRVVDEPPLHVVPLRGVSPPALFRQRAQIKLVVQPLALDKLTLGLQSPTPLLHRPVVLRPEPPPQRRAPVPPVHSGENRQDHDEDDYRDQNRSTGGHLAATAPWATSWLSIPARLAIAKTSADHRKRGGGYFQSRCPCENARNPSRFLSGSAVSQLVFFATTALESGTGA